MDGTARLLSESHAADIPEPEGVVRALEGRVSVLSVLRSALREQSVFLCIGSENPEPALHWVTVVGASTGSATGSWARSASSARCGWTTAGRSTRSVTPRAS